MGTGLNPASLAYCQTGLSASGTLHFGNTKVPLLLLLETLVAPREELALPANLRILGLIVAVAISGAPTGSLENAMLELELDMVGATDADLPSADDDDGDVELAEMLLLRRRTWGLVDTWGMAEEARKGGG